jgi:hypothetical protein
MNKGRKAGLYEGRKEGRTIRRNEGRKGYMKE